MVDQLPLLNVGVVGSGPRLCRSHTAWVSCGHSRAFDVALPGGTRFGSFALFASSRVRSCANYELARRAEGKAQEVHAAYFAAAIIA
jgi:hypothetical protein